MFQNMFRKTIALPLDSMSRGRLIGKDGRKIKDIKEVSSAEVVISGNDVYISAEKEDAVKLAEMLVIKALKHLDASNAKQKIVTPKNVVKADISVAVYFTYEIRF